MNQYELALVINGKLDDENRDAALAQVKEYIERAGAAITNIDDWGKRRLAYEIEKIREGFYYFIKFESASSVPAELESRLRIMETVLRFLVIRLDA